MIKKIFLLSITFLLSIVFANKNPIENSSIFLVKPYVQSVLKNEARILFETFEDTKAIVLFGEVLPLEEKIESNKNKFHEVFLKNLKSNEKYFYQIIVTKENNTEIESEIYSFQTAFDEKLPITFGIISDTQNNPEVNKNVAERIFSERPNFVVHAGDIVGNGNKKNEWVSEFLNSVHTLMSRVPIFAALGNHDEDAEYYYQYLSNSKDEFCFSFNYAETQFILVDSNRDLQENSEQYQKIELLLKDSKSKWKIVVFHHPPYSSDENDYGDTWKGKSVLGDRELDELVKLLEKYNVDIVINGHIHSYERTFPIRNNKINEENGITYLIMGGAGGGLELPAPTRTWFSSKVKSCHHYGIAQIYDNKFQLKTYDLNGNLIDFHELNKK
ncbi:MAG: metallophosphoesterase family protein [Ignavibacteriae bacterium]|nr:metallophosphoesterase family protein [Ignavibacteriota bacterium]